MPFPNDIGLTEIAVLPTTGGIGATPKREPCRQADEVSLQMQFRWMLEELKERRAAVERWKAAGNRVNDGVIWSEERVVWK